MYPVDNSPFFLFPKGRMLTPGQVDGKEDGKRRKRPMVMDADLLEEFTDTLKRDEQWVAHKCLNVLYLV